MATDNETVEDIVNIMRGAIYPVSRCPDLTMRGYADRIESAHKREVAELKTAYDRAVSADARHAVDNERLNREVAELKRELELTRQQRNRARLDMQEKFMHKIEELRECLKEAVRLHCDNLDGDCLHCIRCGVCDYLKWRKTLEGDSI